MTTLFIGIAIGAIFYPKSNIEEKTKEEVSQQYEQKIQDMEQKQSTEIQTLNQKVTDTQTEKQQLQEETSKQLETLTTENNTLKQSSKRTVVKVVKPDGTVTEKEVDESTSDSTNDVVAQAKQDFQTQISSIQETDKKHEQDTVSQLTKQYSDQIQVLKDQISSKDTVKESEKTVQTNQAKLRPEIGITSTKNLYLHATYTLFGPIFVGAGVSGTTSSFGDARLGLGIEL